MNIMLIVLAAAAMWHGVGPLVEFTNSALLILSGIGITTLNLVDDPQLLQDTW
jgi:low affinity Fe/Cu permease